MSPSSPPRAACAQANEAIATVDLMGRLLSIRMDFEEGGPVKFGARAGSQLYGIIHPNAVRAGTFVGSPVRKPARAEPHTDLRYDARRRDQPQPGVSCALESRTLVASQP